MFIVLSRVISMIGSISSNPILFARLITEKSSPFKVTSQVNRMVDKLILIDNYFSQDFYTSFWPVWTYQTVSPTSFFLTLSRITSEGEFFHLKVAYKKWPAPCIAISFQFGKHLLITTHPSIYKVVDALLLVKSD